MADLTNGHVKWWQFWSAMLGIVIVLVGYQVSAYQRLEDRWGYKLDNIACDVSAIKVNISSYTRQIDINTVRLDRLENKVR